MMDKKTKLEMQSEFIFVCLCILRHLFSYAAYCYEEKKIKTRLQKHRSESC